ncbi:MAG: type II secretion system protein [Gemmatimonadaceae bacterium]
MLTPRLPPRRRPAFTLVEMVFAVAIIAVIASSVVVSLSGYRDRRAVDDSYAFLVTLVDSVYAYERLITRLPARLNHLTTMIDGNRATNYQGTCPAANPALASCRTSCGASGTFTGAPAGSYNYTTADSLAWRDNGPFFHRPLDALGTVIGIGTVSDVLVREPSNTGGTLAESDQRRGVLQIQILSVLAASAQRLDRLVDGVDDQAAGTIQWTGSPGSDGRIPVVFWRMPVRGC